MADYDWNTWEEETTKNWSDADVNDVDRLYQEQLLEEWDDYFENPLNYPTMRQILDDLGM